MTKAGLFGWPKVRDCDTAAGIEVFGVPSDLGHSYLSGTRQGPAAIRAASQSSHISLAGVDHGDCGRPYEQDWKDVISDVEAKTAEILSRGACPVILGGDHAVSYAAIAGAGMFDPINIVWFDAHTDFCSWTPADWHNHKQVLRRIAELPHVGQIVQVGHRGITYFDEIDRFDRLRVIRAGEAEASLSAVLGALPGHEPVYMSIDIDAIDPRLAPGTGHPVPGGLSVETLSDLACAIVDERKVIGMDLMEVNPMLDCDGMTSAAAVSILESIIDRRGGQTGTSDHPALARPTPEVAGALT
ncbi:MAG: arginase family protein [Erythrobacter sp.]|nr:arginase family protein [Erythrobacter sp.]